MPEHRTKRRWFQFSIGTMLMAVTVFALWLAWEQSYIRERQETRKWVEQQGGQATSVKEWNASVYSMPPNSPSTITIPFWRRWLGDEAIHEVELPYGTEDADLARVKLVFPEAQASVAMQFGINTGAVYRLQLAPDSSTGFGSAEGVLIPFEPEASGILMPNQPENQP